MMSMDCRSTLIGSKAVEAMLMEAICAPAPGLVDRFNAGAHDDMDVFTFMKSTSALAPAMYACSACGFSHEGMPRELLLKLREIGVRGEVAMFQATAGVNTQKGLLFIMGILCAATGAVVKRGGFVTIEEILNYVKEMCVGIVKAELDSVADIYHDDISNEVVLTAGERLYVLYGLRGVRGEVEDGFPSVLFHALPAYEKAMEVGACEDDCLLHALLSLMSVVDDTTIVCRHGLNVLEEVKANALRIMNCGGALTKEGKQAIVALDESYSRRRISPGGSADLLAATYFLYEITKSL